MFRYLWSLVLTMVVTACASGRSEQRPVSEASPPPPAASPAPGAQAGAPGVVTPGTASDRSDVLRKDAQEALSRTQARLEEATREQQFARSEVDGSRQDLQRAQQQADAASRSNDALARARAAEAVGAAMDRSRVAEAHADYAQQLVAARTADVDAARAHLALVELQIAPATDVSHDQRVAEAMRTEEHARSRALELGQAALATQRQWQALAQAPANRSSAGRASSPPPSVTESGTGSGATQEAGSGAAAPAPGSVPTR
jgi:chromosome segregation ATPase